MITWRTIEKRTKLKSSETEKKREAKGIEKKNCFLFTYNSIIATATITAAVAAESSHDGTTNGIIISTSMQCTLMYFVCIYKYTYD